MTEYVQLSISDARKANIVVDADAGPVIRNAAMLLQEAWPNGSGTTVTASGEPLAKGIPSFVLRAGQNGTGEGFRLHWDKDTKTLTITGEGPKGVLYGVDEVLDRMRRKEDELSIDLQGYKGRPDAVLRSIAAGQLLDCSPREITRVLKALARLRFNQVLLSRYSPGYENMPELEIPPSREIQTQRESTNQVIKEAARWGLSTALGVRLLDFPAQFLTAYPDAAGQGAALCPLAPDTIMFVRKQMEEMVTAHPGIAGLGISGSEAQSDVFACHCPRCRDMTPSERFGVLLENIADVLGDRRICFRTYLSGWRNIKEPEYYRDMADHVPTAVDIQVNAMWSDQFITHPPHPLIGVYPEERIEVNFDLWGEYWGWGEIPCCLADYLSERMNYCYDHGVSHYSGRVSWAFFDSLYNGTLNELNYHIFARLLWDRHADTKQVVHSWAAHRFGKEAADGITEIMYFTWDIVTRTMYANEMLINSHSHPPESLMRFRYLMRDFSAPFFDDGLERSRLTRENVTRWMAEKREAVDKCQHALSVLSELKHQLGPQQHRELYSIFYDTLQTVRVWYHLCDAVWKYELLCREESELLRPQMREEILAAVEQCERQVWQAKRCDPGYAFGILNELRIALKRPVAPWGGYVPTGRSEERLQNKVDNARY